jgi:hypothetical protein
MTERFGAQSSDPFVQTLQARSVDYKISVMNCGDLLKTLNFNMLREKCTRKPGRCKRDCGLRQHQ